MSFLPGEQISIKFGLVSEDFDIRKAAHDVEHFLDLRLQVNKRSMPAVLFLLLHRHEEQADTRAGDEFEIGEIKSELSRFSCERWRQFGFKAGHGRIIKVAIQQEGNFALT